MKFVHVSQHVKPYPLDPKSYPFTRFRQLLESEFHLNTKFFSFPLSFLFLSLLPLLSPSPSHLLHVLHVQRAILVRFKPLPNPRLRNLKLEKYPGGAKHRRTQDKIQFLWIRLNSSYNFLEFQTSSTRLQILTW